MEHTKGTWKVVKTGSIPHDSFCGSDEMPLCINCGDGETPIAQLDFLRANHMANARLIAAAPDLLNSAKKLIGELGNSPYKPRKKTIASLSRAIKQASKN